MLHKKGNLSASYHCHSLTADLSHDLCEHVNHVVPYLVVVNVINQQRSHWKPRTTRLSITILSPCVDHKLCHGPLISIWNIVAVWKEQSLTESFISLIVKPDDIFAFIDVSHGSREPDCFEEYKLFDTYHRPCFGTRSIYISFPLEAHKLTPASIYPFIGLLSLKLHNLAIMCQCCPFLFTFSSHQLSPPSLSCLIFQQFIWSLPDTTISNPRCTWQQCISWNTLQSMSSWIDGSLELCQAYILICGIPVRKIGDLKLVVHEAYY